jgi:hypothetical protein
MPLEYGEPYPIATYFFLAAFTGFFVVAFVLIFLTILNIKYVLSIYKFIE